MKKIAWVIDSTAYVTEELRQHPDVYVIPLSIIFGDEIYEDGVTITTEEIHRRMRDEGASPTTSQPPVGQFAVLYEELKEKYEQLIMIHVSNKLSGTLSSSKQGAEIAGMVHTVIDSRSLSYGITFLLEEGIALHEAGKSTDEVKLRLEEKSLSLENYILVGSLKQLHKSGRMNSAQFFLGTMLSIKPILQIRNGIIEVEDKVRTEKKAIQTIIKKSVASIEKNQVRKVTVLHGNREEDAYYLKDTLLKECEGLEVVVCPISSTISVHAGEGTLALLWYNK